MKLVVVILALLAVFAFADDQCTEAKQIACVDDFRAGYPICKKAAESGGSDLPATLACLKYFNKMKPECWPCICWFAHQFDLPVQGC